MSAEWTWKDELIEVLAELGGEAGLPQIYAKVQERGRKKVKKSSIRDTLERHCPTTYFGTGIPIFYQKYPREQKGIYGLILSEHKKWLQQNSVEEKRPVASNPTSDVERQLRNVIKRQGQPRFRAELLRIYGHKCAVSGTNVPDVLEAAHIIPYAEAGINRLECGILLRSDIHTLFDCGLLAIDDEYKVILHPDIQTSEYGKFFGKKINLPQNPAHWPNKESLREHRKRSNLEAP